MMGLPKLPTEISNDGREVWAWAAELGKAAQKAARIRALRQHIYQRPTECGACQHWMKSRDCPRETNVNGRNRGPSMKAPICSKFLINRRDAANIEKMQAQLLELSGCSAPAP